MPGLVVSRFLFAAFDNFRQRVVTVVAPPPALQLVAVFIAGIEDEMVTAAARHAIRIGLRVEVFVGFEGPSVYRGDHAVIITGSSPPCQLQSCASYCCVAGGTFCSDSWCTGVSDRIVGIYLS